METRITLEKYRASEIDMRYRVEYLKSKTTGWKCYAKVDTIGQAEVLRQQCKNLNGNYKVMRQFRGKRFQRYRIVEDLNYGTMYSIEYKYLLQGWHKSHYSYRSLDDAVDKCEEMCASVTGMSRYGIFRFFKNLRHTVSSIVLCLRYPFLYPRNRFTGKHYSNWKLNTRINQLFIESRECTNYVKFHKGMTEEELAQIQNPKYRITNRRKAINCSMLKIYRFLLEVIHCVPTYTEMDAMDRGWRKAFGDELLRDLKKILKKNHYLRKYRIFQIKEKWGELCWYDACAPHGVFDMLRKYEDLSYRTCIECGKPAKYRTVGYILPYCEQCMPKRDIECGRYTELKENENKWIEIDPEETINL